MNEVIVEHDNHIAIVTLNRPSMKHAFNTRMAKKLITIFKQLDESDARVIILRSSTEDAFCTGADLKERKEMTNNQWHEQHILFEDMFNAIADTRQPVIAAINGYALAGGFELALNSDLIIAGTEAVFGLVEVKRGIMPGGGGARLLPKRVPLHIAKEWLFTGAIIDAQEANHYGLLNRLVLPEKVFEEALLMATKIAESAPLGVQGVKRVADASMLKKESARHFEIETYNTVINSEDRYEGILAFNEKRAPQFKGR